MHNGLRNHPAAYLDNIIPHEGKTLRNLCGHVLLWRNRALLVGFQRSHVHFARSG